jgi:hypothetical protein
MHRPYTVVLAAVLLIPGTLAIIYGDEVSSALSNIAAGTISRLIGILLVSGSILTLPVRLRLGPPRWWLGW